MYNIPSNDKMSMVRWDYSRESYPEMNTTVFSALLAHVFGAVDQVRHDVPVLIPARVFYPQ